jgi:hypothetical protein
MRLPWWGLAIALVAASAGAQTADAVRSGAKVRVWETQPDRAPVELIARVRSTDANAITLDAPEGPVTIAWSKVSHVDVSAGPHSGPRWRSGLIGALGGAIGAGVLGVIVGNASNHNAPKFGAVGLVAGGAAGAAIGTTQPGERWTTEYQAPTPESRP